MLAAVGHATIWEELAIGRGSSRRKLAAVERTQAGLSRAKAEGKALGRPPSLTEAQGRRLWPASISRNTIMRLRDARARAVASALGGLERQLLPESTYTARPRVCDARLQRSVVLDGARWSVGV